MRLCLLGYGKMGKEIAAAAKSLSCTVEKIVDPHAKEASENKLSKELLEHVDACIDFSQSEAISHTLSCAIETKTPLIIGTTGWEEKLPFIKKQVQENAASVLYAPNFSLGVFIFHEIVKKAALLLGKEPSYEASIHEIHHKEKKDAPSGTAKQLAWTMLPYLTSKESTSFESSTESENVLSVSSERYGSEKGTHTITFRSEYDKISLSHQSFSRRSYAEGALKAAKWLQGKQGFFTFEDFFYDQKPK